jgi:hypothetical protein
VNLNEPRTGGLMLCKCGHPKAYHFRQPKWFGGPMTENAPCAHCTSAPHSFTGCQEYVEGDFQGYRLEQEGH